MARGSQLGCLLLTEGAPGLVAERLNRLIAPHAIVDPARHTWMPIGRNSPEEAKLGECPRFLCASHRELITTWWLAIRKRANTPNWDIASTATIDGQDGLVLIEAKAHSNELKTDGKPLGNRWNHERIAVAINEANVGFTAALPGWYLSRDTHYQLANRFAWAWKIATLGVPVVLIYLGFLQMDDMRDQGAPLVSGADWDRLVRDHAAGVVPDSAWERRFAIGSATMRPLIRSVSWFPIGVSAT